MTIEHRNLITLEEILGLQLECRACHAKIIVPISDDKALPDHCPRCPETWVVSRSDLHGRFFMAVREFRKAAKEITDGSNNVNCILSLEIKSALLDRSE